MNVIPIYYRRETHEVAIGNLAMGGKQPIRIQTMCNTPTHDVVASIAQCKRVAAAGADYVRLTVQGMRETEALAEIKKRLRYDGFSIPIIADIHYRPDVALAVAAVADKVRINPGNFANTQTAVEKQLLELIDVCRAHNTALRIGVNHGSLAARIMEQYGNTPEGMVESAMEFLHICRREAFLPVVVSIKSSNTKVMVAAYRLLAERMMQESLTYPLHLGVTEAGDGMEGRIKSAIGIGALLSEGLGDTIRVSLTEPPENEIPVAKKLIAVAPLFNCKPQVSHEKIPLLERRYNADSLDDLLIYAACDAGHILLDNRADDLKLSAIVAGRPLPDSQANDIALTILQAARIRFTKPEYIACPGCGRTLFDLQKTLNEIRAATACMVGVKIAIMGCIVNGPGEMADADYGYVGAGAGKITLYKGKQPIKKNIPETDAVKELLELIYENGNFK